MGEAWAVNVRFTLPALAELEAVLEYIAARPRRARAVFKPAYKRSQICFRRIRRLERGPKIRPSAAWSFRRIRI